MRIGYLGPGGHLQPPGAARVRRRAARRSALATLYDTVMAVQEGAVDAALVPIENSLEGSVDVTLDTLATDAAGVAIVGETVAEIRNCLIAAAPDRARRDRDRLLPPAGQRAVRALPAHAPARRQGDLDQLDRRGRPQRHRAAGRPTRRARQPPRRLPLRRRDPARGRRRPRRQPDALRLARPRRRRASASARCVAGTGAAKTSIVFWGAGDAAPGWLVQLPRRARRPRHQPDPDRVAPAAHRARPLHVLRRLRGRHAAEPTVAAAIDGLRARCQEVRVLGSYRRQPDGSATIKVARSLDSRLQDGKHRNPATSEVRVARRAPATRA